MAGVPGGHLLLSRSPAVAIAGLLLLGRTAAEAPEAEEACRNGAAALPEIRLHLNDGQRHGRIRIDGSHEAYHSVIQTKAGGSPHQAVMGLMLPSATVSTVYRSFVMMACWDTVAMRRDIR